MAMSLTQELLARAQSKLRDAESALEADSTNRWLKMSVELAQDKVESIRRGLVEDERH
jgi:hypothetical protein